MHYGRSGSNQQRISYYKNKLCDYKTRENLKITCFLSQLMNVIVNFILDIYQENFTNPENMFNRCDVSKIFHIRSDKILVLVEKMIWPKAVL